MQQEAAYGIWNLVSHDKKLLEQAVGDNKIVETYVALLRTQSPPAIRYVEGKGERMNVRARGGG